MGKFTKVFNNVIEMDLSPSEYKVFCIVARHCETKTWKLHKEYISKEYNIK